MAEDAKSTSAHLTLKVLLGELMVNVIKNIAKRVLVEVAMKMAAKRGARGLVSSIPGPKIDPRKKLLRLTLNIAVGVLGNAYDLYAQYGLDKNLMVEFDKLKNNLIAVGDDSLHKVFENYQNNVVIAFNEALKQTVYVKH
ncbi:MAG: hypothetical protein ABFS56_14235 [Pseudomonadota bacterium]